MYGLLSILGAFNILLAINVSHPYVLPLNIIKPTSFYGMRIHPISKKNKLHQGIDLAAKIGTPVRAVAYGEVIFSGAYQGYGQLVSIYHANGYTSHYAHLSKETVKLGEVVKPAQIIGEVGNTGISTGSHLHCELRKEGKSLDPSILLQMVKARSYE